MATLPPLHKRSYKYGNIKPQQHYQHKSCRGRASGSSRALSSEPTTASTNKNQQQYSGNSVALPKAPIVSCAALLWFHIHGTTTSTRAVVVITATFRFLPFIVRSSQIRGLKSEPSPPSPQRYFPGILTTPWFPPFLPLVHLRPTLLLTSSLQLGKPLR